MGEGLVYEIVTVLVINEQNCKKVALSSKRPRLAPLLFVKDNFHFLIW